MKRYIRGSAELLQNKIYDAWMSALNELGYAQREVHLFNYAQAKQLEKVFRRNLDKNRVDLSYRSTPIVLDDNIELNIGGNSQSIANNLIRGVIKAGWKPTRYVDIESAARLYEEDRYGYCNPIGLSRAQQLLKQPTGFRYSGIGSQSYSDETSRNFFEDTEGNIKIEISVLRWD